MCRYRKKSGGLVDTLGKMVRRQDYDSYTELEMHAELVRMMLFMMMLLTVTQCYTMLHTITCAWCRCTPSASC